LIPFIFCCLEAVFAFCRREEPNERSDSVPRSAAQVLILIDRPISSTKTRCWGSRSCWASNQLQLRFRRPAHEAKPTVRRRCSSRSDRSWRA